jgi:hypothetical protein
MIKASERPFLPQKIPLDGGGLDFLGLRWVNLKLLADILLPGINNATQDFGTYCLATWIAWKFRRICKSDRDFNPENFAVFREAVEVAMSHAIRQTSSATIEFGPPHRNIGIQQKVLLPGQLTFANAKRGNSTSVFSAPLYGPSLKFVGLLTEAEAIDGTSTGIPIPHSNPAADFIGQTVEGILEGSTAFSKLTRLGPVVLSEGEIDNLALTGLHPARWRRIGKNVKRKFLSLLTPANAPNGRTTSAQLLVSTVRRLPGKTLDEIRAVWHTGLSESDKPFELSGELELHRQRWALFQIRQYQRWIIELFLYQFEVGLLNGVRSLDELTARLHRESGLGRSTLSDLFYDEARSVSSASDWNRVANQWTRKVGPSDEKYVGTHAFPCPEGNEACEMSFRLLARWWIPTCVWVAHAAHQDTITLGGEDRMSIKWFHDWIRARLSLPVRAVLREILEQLVFAQHVRIALSRFDGESQRLRFALGDHGIVPTQSTLDKLTNGIPGWTADRLNAFANILDDLSVITIDNEGRLTLGELADEIGS